MFGAPTAATLSWSIAVGDNPIVGLVVGGVERAVSQLSGTYATSVATNTNTTFNMQVTDGDQDDYREAYVRFYHKRFWFTSSDNLLLSAGTISALLNSLPTGELASSRQMERDFTPNNEYIYFAYPASFGTASFNVGGFDNTDYRPLTFSHTNAFGYTEPYILYRSGDRGISANPIRVKLL